MRILLVKTSSLGDVIHCCPAVSDINRCLPAARIDWVVEEPFAAIAAMHPGVHRVLPVAVRRWRSRLTERRVWQEISAFRKALRAQSYDVIVDAQGLLKSALIARMAHGVRHGYDAASAREMLASRCYDRVHAVARNLHAVERNRLLIAAALGYVLEGECEYGLRPDAGVPALAAKPYCVLLSMTSRADKLWPQQSWVALVRLLHKRGWQSILPWGNAAEQARCAGICREAGAGIVPPALDLAQLASLMLHARAVFGVDTGLSHLAAAIGVPAVGIFCGSESALTGLRGGNRAVNLGAPRRPPGAHEVLTALDEMI